MLNYLNLRLSGQLSFGNVLIEQEKIAKWIDYPVWSYSNLPEGLIVIKNENELVNLSDSSGWLLHYCL